MDVRPAAHPSHYWAPPAFHAHWQEETQANPFRRPVKGRQPKMEYHGDHWHIDAPTHPVQRNAR